MQFSLEVYQFQKGEKIASVGAGGALWEVGFGFECDEICIYVQDINPELITPNEINDSIASLEKIYKKPFKSTIYSVVGSATKTHLPDNFFDKILIINSLHEFEYAAKIISDLRTKLIKGGKIFVEEQLASFTKEIHQGCGKLLFTKIELIALFKKNGFVCKNTFIRNKNVSIFCFEKG